jgi:hypothetical protein
MNIKAIFVGAALALSFGGVAFAGALDVVDHLNKQPVHTGAITNQTFHSKFKPDFMSIPKAKPGTMKECQDAAQSKPYAEVCPGLNALAGS